MSNSRFNTSNDAVEIAKAAFKANKVVKRDEDFEIFEVVSGDLNQRLLLLFKEGKDFLSSEFPSDIIIPVEIDGRKGYLWNKKSALAFRSDQ